MGIKTYTILKGKHYSLHLPKLTYDRKILEVDVKMYSDCWFPMSNPDSYAINKLIGWSMGYHHNNSFRIGWRPAGSFGYIELFFYLYIDGKRFERFFTTVPCNKLFRLCLALGKNNTITASIDDSVVMISGYSFNNIPKLGYILFPYFGGKNRAPYNIHIDLDIK